MKFSSSIVLATQVLAVLAAPRGTATRSAAASVTRSVAASTSATAGAGAGAGAGEAVQLGGGNIKIDTLYPPGVSDGHYLIADHRH